MYQSVAYSYQSVMSPYQNVVNPYQNVASPYQNAVIPYQNAVIPYQNAVIPYQNAVNPYQNAVVPYQNAVNAVNPYQNVANPYQSSMYPYGYEEVAVFLVTDGSDTMPALPSGSDMKSVLPSGSNVKSALPSGSDVISVLSSKTVTSVRKRTYDEALQSEQRTWQNTWQSTWQKASLVPYAIEDGKEDERDSPGLPRELTDKFGPYSCRLCNTTASSTVSAKIHYAGKPHRKQVKKFLEEWSERTGQPMPKLSKPEEVELDQDVTYCNVCNIVLTSVSNAKEHYAGQKHKKALRKIDMYEESKPLSPPPDPFGRFGIGVAFLGAEEKAQYEKLQQKVKEKQAEDKKNLWLCDLCNVRAHTENQLQIHLAGSKHQKALRRSQPLSVVPEPGADPSESILASVIQPDDSSGTDYSMHRTPSEISEK